jgi:hypothetical protein
MKIAACGFLDAKILAMVFPTVPFPPIIKMFDFIYFFYKTIKAALQGLGQMSKK